MRVRDDKLETGLDQMCRHAARAHALRPLARLPVRAPTRPPEERERESLLQLSSADLERDSSATLPPLLRHSSATPPRLFFCMLRLLLPPPPTLTLQTTSLCVSVTSRDDVSLCLCHTSLCVSVTTQEGPRGEGSQALGEQHTLGTRSLERSQSTNAGFGFDSSVALSQASLGGGGAHKLGGAHANGALFASQQEALLRASNDAEGLGGGALSGGGLSAGLSGGGLSVASVGNSIASVPVDLLEEIAQLSMGGGPNRQSAQTPPAGGPGGGGQYGSQFALGGGLRIESPVGTSSTSAIPLHRSASALSQHLSLEGLPSAPGVLNAGKKRNKKSLESPPDPFGPCVTPHMSTPHMPHPMCRHPT